MDRSSLLRTCQDFYQAFISSADPGHMLAKYFASDAQITEHGPEFARARLPFIGTTFKGRRQVRANAPDTSCDQHFGLLGATLKLHSNEKSLPTIEEYVVDPTSNTEGLNGSGFVSVRANAKLEAVKSGKSSEANFAFVFRGFDAEATIGRMEIWADNLSAWSNVGD